ncbi:MAG: glycogen debranching enzyme GlgX [Gemmataceae bacterium]|nr:glycogen debranching enzyme GlgX [Gemmataceae bacterium]
MDTVTQPNSSFRTNRGRSAPLGATPLADGVNFVLMCRHGTSVHLVLQAFDSDHILAEISLDYRKNRTGDIWHIHVADLPKVFRYGWRVDGPVGGGHRFDPNLILLDPSCTAISDGTHWGCNGNYFNGGNQARGTHRRSLFYRRPYDWRKDEPMVTPIEDSVIYELHVRGFTASTTAMVSKPGTFLGLVEKIPYLRQLGVTAVELLPVFEFDEDDCVFVNPLTGENLKNFWGYNSIAFAALKAAYAHTGAQHDQVYEFRDMVRLFHEAGIEVILDVVFNHTGEGDDRGRTYSFRGLDNELYYLLGPNGNYLNLSGCGNTVNCNHPIVRELILTCLRFWVGEMHVDGLRFDLASVFGRDRKGNVIIDPPIVEMISEDGLLRDTKLIAEPWDAAGLYQVGSFPTFGARWSEWNGRYRDDVRRFWRGEPGMGGALATRICGSSDLYQHSGRLPSHSLNFITGHDGFTLWDLVSYNHKHNEANGERNRDGMDENFSWNCGTEGVTHDPEILCLRRRQARNLLTTLMISQGVPMLLGGDEFLRTQKGNNNAWCQDNELSWIDWRLRESHADFLRFTTMLISLRKRHPALRRRTFFKGTGPDGLQRPDVIWHGVEPFAPDFFAGSRTLAFCLDGMRTDREPDRDFYVACNAWIEPIAFRIPRSPNGQRWRRAIDTSLLSPLDIVGLDEGPVVLAESTIHVAPHSMIVLIAEAS